jgi:ATP/maltotriose-dependent transcriptional regulator MalT
MSIPLLATKLYVPPPRPRLVLRPRLVERLNEEVQGKLTLISAPAGFGKTTLISEWVGGCDRQVAWLSLDEGDNDPARFLTYLAAALRTITPAVEEWVSGVLQSPQPPSAEVVLTVLLNEITAIPDDFVLVLDDYHVIDAQPADAGLTFLIAAQQHGQQAILLAQPIANTDRFIPYKIFLARVKLAQGETAEAAVILSEAMQFVRQHNFGNRIPEVAAAQVLVLLRQGHLVAAARLAQMHDLPLS